MSAERRGENLEKLKFHNDFLSGLELGEVELVSEFSLSATRAYGSWMV